MKWLPRAVAFFVGGLSLAQEILWTRLVGFVGRGIPESFAIVLFYYLIGIAIGAHFGKQACKRGGDLVALGASILLGAGLFDLAAPFAYVALHEAGLPMLGFAPIVIVTAALKSVLFPIVHHLGSNDRLKGQGASFSCVYFSNVMGCTVGPLLFALVILDHLSLQQCFLIVGIGTTAIAACMYAATHRTASYLVGLLALASIGVMWLPNILVSATADRFAEPGKIVHIVETKEGIVHTQASDKGDVVFGGNVYDGRINVDLRSDANRIDRLYALVAAQGAPRSVLVVGLSTGAWTEILSTFPSVERIDAVEINPGYLELISRYPAVAPILHDPRVQIHVDDGRRWLRRHPERRFDLIAINNTFHWRANTTNLLSREFMTLVSERLAPAGIVLFNTTGSPDVVETASLVFRYVQLYRNTVFASDHDFRPALARNIHTIFDTRRRGRPVFSREDPADRRVIAALAEIPFVGLDEVRASAGRPLEIITDDNMITEYKYGAPLD